MRVLLDTNIVLDYLGANQGFTEEAERVFAGQSGEKGPYDACRGSRRGQYDR